ncbi:LamB/YcsF family protein [Bacillaceae bacterium SIJ1]|uniref:LamB/YcsF family protein n=1 Tax=Litoribacterium kuwaitense TaxID=1398745 RepID=UPI0013E9DA16|nr:5-oxoprolinase subunit PxpA [Litoribacterium kuwaitense]NGP44688.1 LamB/YcsF family protein [Litoribacterium kuwaitense]
MHSSFSQTIDVNCDLGESFGTYTFGMDEEIMHFVSSVNIACGFHAGDPQVMRHTVQKAKLAGVAIGAHPGLPDLQGFGRRAMAVSPEEVYAMMIYQIGALLQFCYVEQTILTHVKPHGALYTMAATDKQIAEAIAQAVADTSADLLLYGLSGSALISEGKRAGLQTVAEAFVDRTYQQNGQLTPRVHPHALHTSRDAALAQALSLATAQRVQRVDTEGDSYVHVPCDSLCIHGDHPDALSFVKALHTAFAEQDIRIQSPGKATL